jgi:glycerol kinase
MGFGLILAVDQGTTNTKALLIDRAGAPVFRTSSPVSLLARDGGFVEQDPMELWSSALAAMAAAVVHAAESNARIEAIAISNQRETALAWDGETGNALTKAISWQCGRSASICDRLAPHAEIIRDKTGLPLAPLISAGKWTWLLENDVYVQRARGSGVLRFGTVDSWLVFRLTNGAVHTTDLTNASRTGLLNLKTLDWDRELLELFGLPETAMPSLRGSSGSFGVCGAIPELSGVPILAAIGDSHAAMFAHGRYCPGAAKATYGTGSSLMALTSSLPSETPGLARTVAWSIGRNTQFAVEGNVAMTGAAIQWLGEFLGLADPAAEIARLASSVPDSGGVYFVPAMLGLGAPYWDSGARGCVTGLGRNHTRAHWARAAIDAIAYQVADVFFAVQGALGIELGELRADGGATRNVQLMQFQADILDRPVLRSRNEELSAMGAGWLAGLALCWWNSLSEFEGLPREVETFAPSTDAQTRTRMYDGWTRAVSRVRSSPVVSQ